MSAPTREEALATLEEGRAALQALFDRLSSDDMTRPATIGVGDWSAKDLLGHIAFWEELAADTLAAWRGGRRPPTEGTQEAPWEGTDAANARNQLRTAAQSLEEVKRRAALAHHTIVEEIQTMSEGEWRATPFYPGATAPTLGELLGRVLGAPTGLFQHAFAHLADLRTFVESLPR